MAKLCVALKNNTTLTEFSFKNTWCPYEGLIALASAIAEANILQSLSLQVITSIPYSFSD